MRQSSILVDSIYKNTNRIIENVLQATIVNNGTNNAVVYGAILKPEETFKIDASNTVFNLELKEIQFKTSGNATENNISIAYQVLHTKEC